MRNLNLLSKQIHEANKSKGFYDNNKEINIPERLCLIHSEISEALEALRKNKLSKLDTINTIFQKEQTEFLTIFKDNIKDTFEDEIADTIIRTLDLCGLLKIDIDQHIKAKLIFNASRPKKHGKTF